MLLLHEFVFAAGGSCATFDKSAAALQQMRPRFDIDQMPHGYARLLELPISIWCVRDLKQGLQIFDRFCGGSAP